MSELNSKLDNAASNLKDLKEEIKLVKEMQLETKRLLEKHYFIKENFDSKKMALKGKIREASELTANVRKLNW